MSKSAGTLLSAEEMSDAFDVDLIRFYFLRNINDRKDFNFTFTDFVNTVNGELINNFGNLVNRTLAFVHSKLGGKVEPSNLTRTVIEPVCHTYEQVTELMHAGKTNQALKVAFDLVNFGNKYFDLLQPWISIKHDEQKCREDIYKIIYLIANIVKICEPFIPFACKKVQNWLGVDTSKFEEFRYIEDFKLPEVEILFKRLDIKEVQEKFKKYVI